MAAHGLHPAQQNCFGWQSARNIQTGIAKFAISDALLNAVNGTVGCDDTALRLIGDAENKSTLGREMRRVSWRQHRITGENCPVFSQPRVSGGRIAGQFTVEIRKYLRRN